MNLEGVDIFYSYSEDDLEDMYNVVIRKPYTVRQRLNHISIWTDEEFIVRLRLGKQTVNVLLEEINELIRFPTNTNHCLSPLQQLLITLRFYASGNMLIAVGDFAGIHVTTISIIVRRVTRAICLLNDRYLSLPEGDEEVLCVHQGFYQIASFLEYYWLLMGLMYVYIQTGGDQAERFRKRKGYFSINFQVACDYRLKIRNILARWPGSTHDAFIFENSALQARFDNGEIGQSLIVADSGYGVSRYVMTPLERPTLRKEELHNESLICTRNCIERAIGTWKRRFPILALGMRVALTTVQDIIVACAILHNISIDQEEEELQVDEEIQQFINDVVPNIHNGHFANDPGYRTELINDYFALLQ